MNRIKRYNITAFYNPDYDPVAGFDQAEEEEHPEGEWVRWEDVKQFIPDQIDDSKHGSLLSQNSARPFQCQ